MIKSLSGYGADFEQRISTAKAAKLLHPFPLPKMGHETLLVVGKKYSSTHCLYIQNISGTYVLACSSAKQVDWNSIFGVQV